MEPELLKVGELSRRTGVSVRALHHYDEIGLLSPRRRTASGHRLYGADDVARLQQVLSLRQLGLPLEEIRDCLARRELSPRRVIGMHLDRVRAEIERGHELRRRLEHLAARFDGETDIPVEELLETIEVMTMFEKYFTREQLDALKQRRERVGEERIREVEAEWPRLIAAVRAEMERGTDPGSPVMRELAARWRALVREFSGGDEGIERSVAALYRGEPGIAGSKGLDGGILAYVGKAAGEE